MRIDDLLCGAALVSMGVAVSAILVYKYIIKDVRELSALIKSPMFKVYLEELKSQKIKKED